MKAKIDKILSCAMILILVVTSSSIAQALQLEGRRNEQKGDTEAEF
jgi:hypothetical protein